MLNTFLFDLDGTLLCMDMKLFEKLYFSTMSEALSDLIEPKKLIKNIWASTEVMIKNLEYKTNEEVFMEDFQRRIDGDLEIYKERFNKYYDEDFLKTKAVVLENKFIREGIKVLKEKGYKIVIATNPLFPLKAIEHRIRWAGFEPSEFGYISHYENNHYCKPQIQYYEEILKDINKDANECMMVGNDVQEDLIAGKIGIKTFLIKDYMIHRTEEEIVSDYIGSYENFYKFIEGLPSLAK
ncbi:MAG: hydrolase [Clostridiales bacterium]|jgi:FMN phosphatase YigB (HAD superfamily)|nr:hydrolase [Clostridiales bacterium]